MLCTAAFGRQKSLRIREHKVGNKELKERKWEPEDMIDGDKKCGMKDVDRGEEGRCVADGMDVEDIRIVV